MTFSYVAYILFLGILVAILLIAGAWRVCLSAGDEGSVPDLHLIKQVEQVEQVARLASEGPARQSGGGSER